MALTVTVAAESKALTTVANVSGMTGVTVSSASILAASALVVAHVGYELARETVTETFQGSDRYRLIATRRPIVSVSAATEDGTDIASEVAIEDREAGLLFRESGWPSNGVLAPGASVFPWPDKGELPYSITYVGGYYLPSFTTGTSGVATSNDRLLPQAIESAAIELAKVLYLRRGTEAAGAVTEERTPDYAVRYGEAGVTNLGTVFGYSPLAHALLAPYVRTFAA